MGPAGQRRCVIGAAPSPTLVPDASRRVVEVRVEGNRRIEADAIRAVLQTRVGDRVRADLIALVRAYQATQAEVGEAFPRLLIEAARHPELQPALDVAWTNIGGLVQLVEHHRDRGALVAAPSLSILSALIGPLFVAGAFRRAQPGPPVEIDAQGHVERFLEGHGARPAPADESSTRSE